MLNVCWRAAGLSMRQKDRVDQIVDVNEVALHRLAVGVQHHRHRAARGVAVGGRRADQIAPARSAEHVVSERQLGLEVVFLHDPRRAQAAAVQLVLDVVLLQHHLLEDLGQRVAAGVRAVRLRLGDRDRVRVEEVPHAGVAADQDELAKRLARARCLEQPEQAFDGHVHDRLRRLLAGRQVQDVGDARHRFVDGAAFGDRARRHLEPRPRGQLAVVAQRAHHRARVSRIVEQACDESLADLAGGAGDQDAGGVAHVVTAGARRAQGASP